MSNWRRAVVFPEPRPAVTIDGARADLLALRGEHAHEPVDHGEERDVEDVDLVRGHEVQQEVDRTLETWRGDRVGHQATLSNRPGPAVHP